ncbi:MAG: acylphosphatase, partial [Betaproteobacteria bacterium]|nr:acylphosphatase [Betaproteobacteria bacterium]
MLSSSEWGLATVSKQTGFTVERYVRSNVQGGVGKPSNLESATQPTNFAAGNTTIGLRIRVRGLVQGVGFRPNVWRLARACGLAGDVRNDAQGVLIRAWGEPAALEHFIRCLRTEAPPLARIDTIERAPLPGHRGAKGFRIVASVPGEVHTGVVPDSATCPACVQDTLQPSSRRYRYPFTNCTHCGPRLSIIEAIPYDR